MSRLSQPAAVVAAIAALAAFNLWFAGVEIDTTPIPVERQAGEAGVAPAEAGQALDLARLNLVQATSRPLFARNRKPWTPPAAPPKPKKQAAPAPKAVAKAAPPPNFRLVGVSIAEGSTRALVSGDASPDPVWVATGDAIDGWTVDEITPKFVTMRRDDRQVSIDLYPDDPENR